MRTLDLDLRPEPDAGQHFERWALAADPDLGLVIGLTGEDEGFPDEPNWPLVRADLAPTAGIDPSGYQFSPVCGGRATDQWGRPEVSALFEAVERYCLSLPRRADLVRRPYTSTTSPSAGGRYLDPSQLLDIAAGHPAAARERQRSRWWLSGRTLAGEPVRVPAQAVLVPCREEDWAEPLLRDPVSTGGACGLRRDWAVVRGYLEVAERDAVMLLHFGVAGHDRVDESLLGGSTRHLVEQLRATGMTATILRIHTGLPVAAVAVRIEDQRGPWPRAALGSCARLTVDDAVRGALLEAAVYKRNLRSRAGYFVDPTTERDDIRCLQDRASFWYAGDRLLELSYFNEPGAPGRWRPTDLASDAGALMDHALRAHDPIVVDVTSTDIVRLGAVVVKVLVPALQPMYLSEARRVRTSRLSGVDLDAHPPHPFL